MDDIKGKTNHNTALHWEYDTRRAWRWNRDPKQLVGLSSYAVFANSPIQFSDPDGDVVKFKGYRETEKAPPMSNQEAEKYWNQMVKYLQDNGLGTAINALINSPTVYEIYFTTNIQNSFVGAYGITGNYTNTNPYIEFNPYKALRTNTYYMLSPIELLNHELGHGYEYEKDPCIELENSMTPDDRYGTKIERIVIEGIELKTAQKIGNYQGGKTRTSHGGDPFKVSSWKPQGQKGGELPEKLEPESQVGNSDESTSGMKVQVGGGDAENRGTRIIEVSK